MEAYLDLVAEVIHTGTRKENRTGVDTLSTFNYNYELVFDAKLPYYGRKSNQYMIGDGFPLLTTKSVSWKNIVVEMLWFLSGQTEISILKRHGCKFWDAWVDDGGQVPSAYGSFWRSFPVHEDTQVCSTAPSHFAAGFNDQIRWVLDELRRNPMSRRMVVSAWAPGNAQTSKLPPCHLQFIFNVQKNSYGENALCLHMTQRSCDVALGVPYNIASYALLLRLFSRFSGIAPGIFAHTLVDAHVYTCKPDGSMADHDHVPGLKSQTKRAPKALPKLVISDEIRDLSDVEALMGPNVTTEEIMRHFFLEGYDPHPAIPFKVAV